MSGSHQRLKLERCRLDGAHGDETGSLRVGCSLPGEELFSCISPPLGVQSFLAFGFLASGKRRRKPERRGLGGFAAEHPAWVLAQRAGGSCGFLALVLKVSPFCLNSFL